MHGNLAKRVPASFGFVAAGFMTYVVWRPEGIFRGYFADISRAIDPVALPGWLVGSLPDALWYAGLLCLQSNVLDKGAGRACVSLAVVALLLPYAHEALQFFGAVRGTFCPVDIAFYLITSLTYLLICYAKINKNLAHSCSQAPSLPSPQ